MLVSMKIKDEGPETYEDNPYGYGLCLRLNPGQCEALGIRTPPVAGTAMTLMARAVAKRVTEEAEEGKEKNEVYLELQVTDMEVSSASNSGPSAVSMLYGD